MSRVHINIIVQEAWRPRFPQVVENCRRAGIEIEHELVAVGVITGSIDSGRLATLAVIEGVAAIEPERDVTGLHGIGSPRRPV
ncbi:hypothetical protein GSY71_09015 [Pusillimonas sp. TS35]|uniref:hypothetical protein n=1 Tax=Paracandidimonas lactea TaxID=2895524 RepID=UPI0013715980|nr:hypothetical protein [Paracandidimonas lactea]MYN13281.1 hypothetical protein [Pusillimonas sp. TS35]